jgi:hypothetical protein
MMCDGEDRVVVVKRKLARVGGGQVIKLGVFRPNALTNPRRRQNRVGNGLGARIFEVEKESGGALLSSGGRATRHRLLGATFPLAP